MAPGIQIRKLDAARRQLRTAITLWFNDGDPVSVHTLACAAYEIIHAVSKKRNPGRRGLIYRARSQEYHAEFTKRVRKPANFFKHADHDPDGVMELDPRTTQAFVLTAVIGLELCGEEYAAEELAFKWWFQVNNSRYVTDAGLKKMAEYLTADDVAEFRALGKSQFFDAFLEARRRGSAAMVH